MLVTKRGTVQGILYGDSKLQKILVEIGTEVEKAIVYPPITGSVQIGDLVLLNTTAVALKLGTGGYHFVMANLSQPCQEEQKVSKNKHIMKLRYTPLQIATGSCEEQDSPFHQQMASQQSLHGMTVLVGELHSMLPIAATYIKQSNKACRIVYIMTDKGALPLDLSDNVSALRELGILNGTITIGQSFGGDLEAINIYSGLIAAKHLLKADIVFVSMGPGIVGTSTALGFSGMEQVEILHAVSTLGGIPVLVPRVSEADQRRRHVGLSHHTKTVLKHTLSSVHIPILEEIASEKGTDRHFWHIGKREKLHLLKEILTRLPFPIKTMGRTIEEDPLFFYSVALAADFADFVASRTNVPSDVNSLSPLWSV
ncbi:DUF3866 family protein [Ammoniphilus resinae]|uniref:DUF3866 family protein n=1 Tax=Ammoniphilus resinae TaxID=861532 RepID=A0ABS4GTD0_9BACL|nr:DUF3866 family protein [Ammoniphilus resinae]MBP1933538.1 hypothetical protein [Ammoniphilus resinae]